MRVLNPNRLKVIQVLTFVLLFLGMVFSPSIQSATAQDNPPTPIPLESIPGWVEPTPLPSETPNTPLDAPPQPAESLEINPTQPSEGIAPEIPAPELVIPCKQISLGGSHTCAITTSGGAKCWGWNYYGQLGIGNTTNKTKPVTVSGMGTGVNIISGGDRHTCALTTGGGVKCWGYNGEGELGNGSTTTRLTPVWVSGMTYGIKAVSSGTLHTCVLTTNGGVKCWGRNGSGQLGNGTTTDRHIPVWVSGMTSGIQAISVGEWHTCALTSSGGVKCWGDNDGGQLGDGTTTDRLTPVWVSGMASGIKAISADIYHTCALTTNGGVKCWGWNYYGQLGNGTTTEHHTPGWVSGMTYGIKTISARGNHTCALTTSGGVKCWGRNNAGQLGDGTTIERHTPVWVSGMTSGIQAISAGGGHTCSLTTTGGVKCWGSNSSGQLGNGTTTYRLTPVWVTW